jgi:hypothetical protein
MSRLNIIGIDLAKTNFYLFSLTGRKPGRIKLSREKLIGWFTTQSRMIVAMRHVCFSSLGQRNSKDGA